MSKAFSTFSDEKAMIIVVFHHSAPQIAKKNRLKKTFLKKTLDNVFFCLHLVW